MNFQHKNRGYTLTELMITMGIIGVLSAIAIPAYNSYVGTSKLATARANAVTLSGFVDTYFYENEAYFAGTYDPSGDTTTLPAALGWLPSGDRNGYVYAVVAGAACGADITSCYTITVTSVLDPTITTTLDRP